jgi:hypothetical protein
VPIRVRPSFTSEGTEEQKKFEKGIEKEVEKKIAKIKILKERH